LIIYKHEQFKRISRAKTYFGLKRGMYDSWPLPIDNSHGGNINKTINEASAVLG